MAHWHRVTTVIGRFIPAQRIYPPGRPDTWIEDRTPDKFFVGHRGGPRPPEWDADFNQYLDSSGRPDPNCGTRFSGGDQPDGPLFLFNSGNWLRFKVEIIDTCVANGPFVLTSKEMVVNF